MINGIKTLWRSLFAPPTPPIPQCPKLLSGAQCARDAGHDGKCGITAAQMAALMEAEFRRLGKWDESR